MSVPLAFHVRTRPPLAALRASGSGGIHRRAENFPWAINVPDHPARSESSDFRASKKLTKKIVATLGVDERFLGTDSVQMHHGGSLWVFDDEGWFMLQNEAGIEWSAQFCADPVKVDALRRNAQRLYAGFPKSIPEMIRLGYRNAETILSTPVTNDKTIARWVDSIFNSCVPLPAVRHVGVLPKGGGRHHYPTPITDIDLVKHDDFELWVTDPESGTPAAVVPVAARGRGVAKVNVVYATPGTRLAQRQATAQDRGKGLELGPRQLLTRQAFALQA